MMYRIHSRRDRRNPTRHRWIVQSHRPEIGPEDHADCSVYLAAVYFGLQVRQLRGPQSLGNDYGSWTFRLPAPKAKKTPAYQEICSSSCRKREDSLIAESTKGEAKSFDERVVFSRRPSFQWSRERGDFISVERESICNSLMAKRAVPWPAKNIFHGLRRAPFQDTATPPRSSENTGA